MLFSSSKKELYEKCRRSDESCQRIGNKYVDFQSLECVQEFPHLVQGLDETDVDHKAIIGAFEEGLSPSPFGFTYVLRYDLATANKAEQERKEAGQIYYYALEKLRLSKHWFDFHDQISKAVKVDTNYYKRLIDNDHHSILRLLCGDRDDFLYNNHPYDAIVHSGNQADRKRLEKAKTKINRYFQNERAHSIILNGYFRLEYSKLLSQHLPIVRRLARKLMLSATTNLLEDVKKLFGEFANSKTHFETVLKEGLEQQRQEYDTKLKMAEESHTQQLVEMHETINRLQDMVDKSYQQNELLLEAQKQQSKSYESQLFDLLEKLKHES